LADELFKEFTLKEPTITTSLLGRDKDTKNSRYNLSFATLSLLVLMNSTICFILKVKKEYL
jgi:hypothetical protein